VHLQASTCVCTCLLAHSNAFVCAGTFEHALRTPLTGGHLAQVQIRASSVGRNSHTNLAQCIQPGRAL